MSYFIQAAKYTFLAGVFSLCSNLAFAQNTDSEITDDEARVLDTVTVTGSQNDSAMAAFRSGDYKTAEVEFLDNAMCALRRERSTLASFEASSLGSERAQNLADSVGTSSGASTRGAGAGQSQDGATAGVATAAARGSRSETKDQKKDRTCEERAFQIYMAGLSQIQLGKTDDALRNFEKASTFSKVLYDAHYRIALIKLIEGDKKTAARNLKKIESILKRCRDCEARPEIEDRITHLKKALAGGVSLK